MANFEFLGPYRIGKILGRGGMGNVYQGEHVKSGERVAVKVIASAVADEPRFRRRFDKEIKTLKMLRHPGIVRLVGFGEQEGQLFYSMELVEGETLQTIIRREKRLSWQTAIRYAIQICAALKHAHDIGVTHRDLKPANLIVTPNDQLKLVDFGIPKVFGDLSEQTAAGSVLGTPDYMAPEQANGAPITSRTDLYALGSVMYAMLTGRAPFRGKNATEVIKSLTRDNPVPLDMLDVEMPTELGELVHELLEKDEQDRPRTALMVANRLKAMQTALAREQTQLADSSKTLVGKEGSSAKSNTRSSRKTKHASDTDAASGSPLNSSSRTVAKAGTVVTRGGKASPTRRDSDGATTKTSVSDIRSTSLDKNNDAAGSLGTRATKSSQGFEKETAGQNEVTGAAPLGTHFHAVDDSPVGSGLFQADQDQPQSKWQTLINQASLIGMIVVLLVGGVLFYQAAQPPSVDELYQRALAGDLSAAAIIAQRFPDDPRVIEMKRLLINHRLDGMLKRLKAKSKMGLSEMSSAEETFLQILEAHETAPTVVAGKLTQWLEVHDEDMPDAANGKDEKAKTQLNEMIEIARFMSEDLVATLPEIRVDQRVTDLLAKIEHAEQFETPADTRKKLEAIIELFADKAWAEPAVEKAEKKLAELNN